MEQKVFLFNSTWIKLEFPSGLLNENNKLFIIVPGLVDIYFH